MGKKTTSEERNVDALIERDLGHVRQEGDILYVDIGLVPNMRVAMTSYCLFLNS